MFVVVIETKAKTMTACHGPHFLVVSKSKQGPFVGPCSIDQSNQSTLPRDQGPISYLACEHSNLHVLSTDKYYLKETGYQPKLH